MSRSVIHYDRVTHGIFVLVVNPESSLKKENIGNQYFLNNHQNVKFAVSNVFRMLTHCKIVILIRFDVLKEVRT